MSNSKKKKSKVFDTLETVFYGIVFVIILVYIMVVASMFIFPSFILPKLGLAKLLFVIVPIFLIVIMLAISIKRDEKKEKEYRDNYVSEVTIEDKVFGEMRFEKDNKKNELSCKDFKIPFGEYNPIITIDDYEEKNKEFYFRNLEYLYSKQTEIIETFFKSLLEEYADSRNLTQRDLKEHFDISDIEIQKCGEYFDLYLLEDVIVLNEDNLFEGAPEDWVISVYGKDADKFFGGWLQNIVAYMDCKTKKICYVLEH